MAKKKTSPKAPARLRERESAVEAAAVTESPELSPADVVAAKAEIADIILIESQIWRADNASTQECELKFDTKDLRAGLDPNQNRVLIRPTFAVDVITKDESKQKIASVTATFVVIYTYPDVTELDDSMLEAFAGTSGVIHAWPVWREFALQASIRMRMPPIVIPLVRLSGPLSASLQARP